jgi:biopolymer transport protein TolR
LDLSEWQQIASGSKKAMAFSVNSGSGAGQYQPMSEINVTPFVDVMLVLLVIFMVTAPMMTQGLNLKLPKAKAGAINKSDEKLTLELTKDHRYMIGGQEIPKDRLKEVLEANPRLKQDKTLLLKADDDLNYGDFVRVVAIARSAGAENIAMITDMEKVKQSQSHSK